MKREVRLPTKSYDLLRQQVQARRGSPTNRREESPAAADVEIATPDAMAGPSAEPAHADDAPAPGPAGRDAPAAAPPGAAAPVGADSTAPEPARRAPRRALQGLPRSAAASARAPAASRITLKLNFTAPAAGVFPFYDRVLETMSPRKAVPLLLAKAFEELEAAARRGEDIRLEEYRMERNGERISTSRTMDVATFEKLRARVDPHDLMKPSSLGAALATSALSLYLRRHG